MNVIAIKDYKTPFVEINKGEKYNDETIKFHMLEDHKQETPVYRLEHDDKYYFLSKEEFDDVFENFRKQKLERILNEK